MVGEYDPASGGFYAVQDLLQSDYEEGRQVTRQFALENVEQIFARLTPTTVDISAPSLARYAAYLTDVPFRSSGFVMFGRDIPFLGLVYNGVKPFVGEPINLSGSPDEAFMKAIENGAGLQFVVTTEPASAFRATQHESLVSTQFDLWAHRITSMERRLRDLYSRIENAVIVRHETIGRNVVMITYRSGERVVLNYGDESTTVDGVLVPGRSYDLLQGEPQ